jgi:hypothetical protein
VGRDDHRYCVYYCEENIWQLAAEPGMADGMSEVWLITNPSRKVATWAQRASTAPDTPIIWDYHVVLARYDETQAWQVWDFDHRGPFVRPAQYWLAASFPIEVRAELAPSFRCIPARDYLREFSSDRRHMRSPEDPDLWKAAPPAWPPIGHSGLPGDNEATFMAWLDRETRGPGLWRSLEEIVTRVVKKS